MPKLYFRYGTMNSSKTMNLLMVAHNYDNQNKKVILIKPSIDNRFGEENIQSRTGIHRNADIVIKQNDDLSEILSQYIVVKNITNINCILCDESQFFTSIQIDSLRKLTKKIPVICYGLRTDYTTKLFVGSKRLMEIADSIEEIKTECTFCNHKAIINMKKGYTKDSKDAKDSIKEYSEPDLGTEDKYLALCWNCWDKQ
jgi:thymidine kinase